MEEPLLTSPKDADPPHDPWRAIRPTPADRRLLFAIGRRVDSHDHRQVLEIDYKSALSSDPWRASRRLDDRPRGGSAVRSTSPDVGVFARDRRVRTIMTGDGPQELPEGVESMSVASDGRLYVSGLLRILEFGPQGNYLGHWTPNLAPRLEGAVCDFGGRPAVPTRNGVVRRSEDGPDEAIGENVELLSGDPDDWEKTDESFDEFWRVQNARILCTPNAAYVVTQYGGVSTYREVSEGVARRIRSPFSTTGAIGKAGSRSPPAWPRTRR